VYKIETYLEADNQAAVWALLVGFCFATPPFNYLISVIARTSTIATYMRVAASILGGLIGSFVVSVLFFATIAPSAGLIIMWILRIFPTYSVAQGLINIVFTGLDKSFSGGFVLRPFDSQILRTCHDTTLYDINRSPFEVCMFVAGDDVIMLFVYGVVYFGLLLLIDYMKSDDKWNPDRDLPVPSEKLGVEDERVIAEKDRVSKLDPTTQMIYFKDLKKVFYPGKKNEAMRGINYALADGGVFGLLGVNGAGKTTTFRMLCGLIRPSSGHISLIGQPLRGNVHEIRKSIGYCPQENPLLQGLTARDHLYMYARIRGVPSDKIPHHVEDLVKILRLEHYIDKEAVKLSGGNQRKLCA
ncbi:Nod factor export ATP-binding protein I, putative, partial [Perkinsus marinus ATCC 50983]